MPASTTLINTITRQCRPGYIFQVFLCVCVLLATFSYLSNHNRNIKKQSTDLDLTHNTLNKESVSQLEHEQRSNRNDEHNGDVGNRVHNVHKMEIKEDNNQNNVNKQQENNENKENSDLKYELSFGHVPWEVTKLKEWFKEFKRDVAVLNNNGGMRLAHQFAVYTVLRERNPKYVIESGVWMGATTKVIRKILPESLIISIDPMCVHKNSSNHEVYCGKAFKDFKKMGARWRTLDKENTVVLFDDHQSGFLRTLQSIEFGFKYIMIEDNYAYGTGDNYSPKQVLTRVNTNKILFLNNFGRQKITISRAEHNSNRQLFKRAVKTYIEFPPLNKPKTVDWLYKTLRDKSKFTLEDMTQITPEGLGIDVPFDIEHLHYRNMCYLELNTITDEIRDNIASINQPK